MVGAPDLTQVALTGWSSLGKPTPVKNRVVLAASVAADTAGGDEQGAGFDGPGRIGFPAEIAGGAIEKVGDIGGLVVERFQSSAETVQGAVDYDKLSWKSYTRVAETPEQFTFYSGRNFSKVIVKKELTDAGQLATQRRVIRRNVADCELGED